MSATDRGGETDAARYPALALWRDELHSGYRGQRADQPGTWKLDALWRAAGWEHSALQAERDGLEATAARCGERAREILIEAARQKRGAA